MRNKTLIGDTEDLEEEDVVEDRCVGAEVVDHLLCSEPELAQSRFEMSA